MLNKLLKHDWKETWKFPTILIGFLLAATLLISLGFFTSLFDFSSFDSGHATFIMYTFVFLFYYMLIIGVALGISVYIAIRFYKNLFTDEGYLTHTLPVTPTQLLLSKILVGMGWSLLAILSIIVSIFIVGSSAIASLPSTEISTIISELYAVFQIPSAYTVFCFIMTMLLGSLQSVLMAYCAICLGQFLTRHRIIGSLVAYLGFYIISQIISSLTMLPYTVRQITLAESQATVTVSSFDLIADIFPFTTLLSLISVILYFFISKHCISKKLNLE
ncbi:MAG: hypothetical protein R3Y24_01525 [Eubacteriales bacterium]